MSVTITLPDDLGTRLQRRAAAERMSVEEFAVHVLADAAERPFGTEEWRALNARRVDLIRKRLGGQLTASEAQELTQLQQAADRHLEQFDERLLEDLERIESAAKQIQASSD
jgi:plasmid stability protein